MVLMVAGQIAKLTHLVFREGISASANNYGLLHNLAATAAALEEAPSSTMMSQRNSGLS